MRSCSLTLPPSSCKAQDLLHTFRGLPLLRTPCFPCSFSCPALAPNPNLFPSRCLTVPLLLPCSSSLQFLPLSQPSRARCCPGTSPVANNCFLPKEQGATFPSLIILRKGGQALPHFLQLPPLTSQAVFSGSALVLSPLQLL